MIIFILVFTTINSYYLLNLKVHLNIFKNIFLWYLNQEIKNLLFCFNFHQSIMFHSLPKLIFIINQYLFNRLIY
jgi:hypothetical protein